VKWGTFIVSSVALAVACVRDPIIWTLRATIQDQLRAELSKYETISTANSKSEKHQDLGDELIKHLDHALAVFQDGATATRTNQALLRDLARSLPRFGTNFQDFRRDFLVSQKSGGHSQP